MTNVVIRGFASIARFRGRDTRAQFWPYAAAIVALYLATASIVVSYVLPPIFAGATSATQLQTAIVRFLTVSLLLFAALVALLAAAVARRLHDSGRSAIWGLLPLPFAAYSGAMFLRVLSSLQSSAPDAWLFLSMFLSNVAYMGGVAILIVFLASRSTPVQNRYG